MSNNTQNTQNNPFTATELLEFANLQIAAEALYGLMANKERGITENKLGNPANIENNPIITNNRDELIDFLTDGNYHSSKFSTTQAEQFVENWEIVSHIANTSSGFSGTLFEAKENIPSANIKKGDLVLSFRSTEFIEDYIHDNIATNTHEIADKGWAFGQISDMEQWFNTLATDLKLKNEDGTYNQQITVTGYSLGGHLATAFHILHQNDNLIKNTFTFNGAGVGDVGGLFDKVISKEELYFYC